MHPLCFLISKERKGVWWQSSCWIWAHHRLSPVVRVTLMQMLTHRGHQIHICIVFYVLEYFIAAQFASLLIKGLWGCWCPWSVLLPWGCCSMSESCDSSDYVRWGRRMGCKEWQPAAKGWSEGSPHGAGGLSPHPGPTHGKRCGQMDVLEGDGWRPGCPCPQLHQ